MPAPKVIRREIDRSQVVGAISNTNAALVGWAKKGPIDEVVPISGAAGGTRKFIDTFGEPEPGKYFHYSALAALRSVGTLYCVRAYDPSNPPYTSGAVFLDESASGSNYALSGSELVIHPKDFVFASTDECLFIGAYSPGEWGDAIKITLAHDANDTEVFYIRVWLPNLVGTFVMEEEWEVSRIETKLDGFGRSMYVEEVVNQKSKYIKVKDNTDIANTVLPSEQSVALALGNGDDGTEASVSNIQTAWETYFANPDAVKVNMLIAGGATASDGAGQALAAKLADIAASRLDCRAIVDAVNETAVEDVISWKYGVSLSSGSGSFIAFYENWAKDRDNINDLEVELPPSGYVAAIYANTMDNFNLWSAPSGWVRGALGIPGVVNKRSMADLDLLANAKINSLRFKAGRGIAIWGQLTANPTKSALSNVGTRNLLNIDGGAVAEYAEGHIDNENTAGLRARITTALTRYFEPRVAQGAYYSVTVVCDDSNNTPATIDQEELIIDVYVQPVRYAKVIRFNTIITPTGVTLSEVEV